MKLYCENCGMPLHHTRKAVQKLGIIVELVSYHECTEIPVPFDISNFPDAGEFKPFEGKDKFVKSLNELVPRPLNKKEAPKGMDPSFFSKKRPTMTGTDDLHDRRFEQDEKSTAPSGVIDQIKSISNSIPEHDLKDIEKDED